MSVRMLICNLCDGEKVDASGDRCVDCAGIGWFPYGDDRPRASIEADLQSTWRILGEDRGELVRASEALRGCPKEAREGRRKQMVMVGESIAYWEARIECLTRELSECKEGAGVS